MKAYIILEFNLKLFELDNNDFTGLIMLLLLDQVQNYGDSRTVVMVPLRIVFYV